MTDYQMQVKLQRRATTTVAPSAEYKLDVGVGGQTDRQTGGRRYWLKPAPCGLGSIVE